MRGEEEDKKGCDVALLCLSLSLLCDSPANVMTLQRSICFFSSSSETPLLMERVPRGAAAETEEEAEAEERRRAVAAERARACICFFFFAWRTKKVEGKAEALWAAGAAAAAAEVVVGV